MIRRPPISTLERSSAASDVYKRQVMGCLPVSSRLITIRLRAVPFNITIVQAYTPTSDYDDNKIEFYEQLQDVIDQTPKKDILVVQGDWNAKVGRDACRNWQGICGPFCNNDTNERGLRLLEFATFNDLVLANIRKMPHRRATDTEPMDRILL